MWRLEAHPGVRGELLRLADEFDALATGSGEVFLRAAGAALDRIHENPESWPLVSEPLHRHRVAGFKIAVDYEVTDDEIYILGVG